MLPSYGGMKGLSDLYKKILKIIKKFCLLCIEAQYINQIYQIIFTQKSVSC